MTNSEDGPSEESESIHQQNSPEQIRQAKEPHSDRHPNESPKQEEEEIRKKAIFFRIWFGLRKRELVKIAVGSFAAAFSGISKPVFGYYIITIGVAYYKHDAERKVGKFSITFALIGFISLFSHTLQHYFFGMVGEKAMTNLRRALYSGTFKYTTVSSPHVCISVMEPFFFKKVITSTKMNIGIKILQVYYAMKSHGMRNPRMTLDSLPQGSSMTLQWLKL
jgi:hypothetical protein